MDYTDKFTLCIYFKCMNEFSENSILLTLKF